MSYPLRGMRFVFRTHRGLVRYWIVPVLITVLALTVLGVFVIDQRVEFANSFWDFPVGAPW